MYDLPASNSGDGTSSRVRSGRGELSVRDGGARGDRSGQLEDGDVAVVGARLVAGVHLDGGDLDEYATGGPALWTVRTAACSNWSSWGQDLQGFQRGP